MSSLPNGDVVEQKLERPHIFVFDYMRTRSHLFWRWFSTHPALDVHYHPYLMSGFLGASRILIYTRNSEKRQAENDWLAESAGTNESHEDSNRKLENDLKKAEQEGKRLFINEHGISFVNIAIQLDLVRKRDEGFPPLDRPFPNPLPVPDHLLDKFTPIVLIRHPVLQVDSVYRSMLANSQCRPGDEDFELITSTRHSRLLFEYFRHARGGKLPIVVDGEDVLWRTEDLGDKLCTALYLAPEGFKDTWDPMPEDRKHSNWFVRAMTATMTDSTGIERPDVKPEQPVLAHFIEKWTHKFGAEVSEQLKERVEDSMPHYKHLVQYKL